MQPKSFKYILFEVNFNTYKGLIYLYFRQIFHSLPNRNIFEITKKQCLFIIIVKNITKREYPLHFIIRRDLYG